MRLDLSWPCGRTGGKWQEWDEATSAASGGRRLNRHLAWRPQDLNPVIHRTVFPEATGRAWLKHNVEEVGLLEYIITPLYPHRR
jgi:hypothetical protein